MLETALLFATMPAHLGVPLPDLVAWAVVIAFLASPAMNGASRDTPVSATARPPKIFEIGGAKPRNAAACHLSDAPRTVAHVAPVDVMPAARRLSAVDQWQTVSRLVSNGADRAMAVARDQQSIRRELDALDFTLENMRRELAAVMTMAIPAASRGAELVAIPVRARAGRLAAA